MATVACELGSLVRQFLLAQSEPFARGDTGALRRVLDFAGALYSTDEPKSSPVIAVLNDVTGLHRAMSTDPKVKAIQQEDYPHRKKLLSEYKLPNAVFIQALVEALRLASLNAHIHDDSTMSIDGFNRALKIIRVSADHYLLDDHDIHFPKGGNLYNLIDEKLPSGTKLEDIPCPSV